MYEYVTSSSTYDARERIKVTTKNLKFNKASLAARNLRSEFWNVQSLLKLHKIIVLLQFFSKTAPPILMKLCMYVGYDQGKVLVPLAPLVIAPFKRKEAGGRFCKRVDTNTT